METKGKTKGGIANLKPCKPGETHNPNGRPLGQRNYATIYREALRKIGETKGMTSDQVEEELLETGLGKALKGDFNFYRDTFDRTHGKAPQSPDDPGSKANPLHVQHSVIWG